MSGLFEGMAAGPELAGALAAEATRPVDSYLFVGPPGVGKADAARVFAAAVLCKRACGNCEVCRRVLKGIHPDVQSFAPEGATFPVEVIREVVVLAAQTPLEAQHRVFILEDAHRIAERSQNALLKALEEPNVSVTWVLVADVIDTFLPTVISRCRVVQFASPPVHLVAAVLSDRFGTSVQQASRIMSAARGDYEKTLALAGDPVARKLRSLALAAATRTGPSAAWALEAAEEVQTLAKEARDARAESFAGQLMEFEETAGKSRGAAAAKKRLVDRQRRALKQVETQISADFLFWLGMGFRDLAAVGCGAGAEHCAEVDAAEAMLEVAGGRPVEFWLEMINECIEGQAAILENSNASLVVESVLLRLTLEALAPRH